MYYTSVDGTSLTLNNRIKAQPSKDNDYKFDLYTDDLISSTYQWYQNNRETTKLDDKNIIYAEGAYSNGVWTPAEDYSYFYFAASENSTFKCDLDFNGKNPTNDFQFGVMSMTTEAQNTISTKANCSYSFDSPIDDFYALGGCFGDEDPEEITPLVKNARIEKNSVGSPISGQTTNTLTDIDESKSYVCKATVTDKLNSVKEIISKPLSFKEESSDDDNTGGGGNIPETPAEEKYSVPMEGDSSVKVEATIENEKAKVSEITKKDLEEFVENTESKTNVDSLELDFTKAKQDVKGIEFTKPTLENVQEVLKSNQNNINNLVVKMSEGTVSLDAKALEAVTEQANGDTIILVVDKTQDDQLTTAKQETLKDYNVNKTFEAYFESNGQRIHDFKGGVATVSMKFEPTQGSNKDNYKIYYLDDNAKMHKYATKYKDGMLVFATTHFSDYVIVYDGKVDVLLAQAKSSKGKIKLSWNRLDNITKYVVYGAKCGHNYKKLKTTTGKSYTVKKASGKKLKAHKTYKFYVVAYDAVGNKISSRSIHYIYKNTQGKYANVKSIKAKYDNLLLSVGVTQKIGAKYKMYAGKKHLKKTHGQALKFFTNNTDVVTVSKTGVVKAVGKGTATIYIQDIGGKYCKTKVTVE